jgi:hypothetical protein
MRGTAPIVFIYVDGIPGRSLDDMNGISLFLRVSTLLLLQLTLLNTAAPGLSQEFIEQSFPDAKLVIPIRAQTTEETTTVLRCKSRRSTQLLHR